MTVEPASGQPSGAEPAPAVILVAPQLGQNIGMTARAMANFGLADLRLVAPRDGWPSEKARAAAAGADHVLDGARLYPTTGEAVAGLHYVCATTARGRDMIKPVLSPDSATAEMRARVRQGQHCGVLFGAEKAGLDNDQVALADAVVTVPVDPAFASLNLAQAVLVMGYEWMRHSGADALGRATHFERPAREGLKMPDTRPATRGEVIALFEHLESELDDSGFLRPPEKRPVMVRNLRNMLLRAALTEQEVRTLRGVVSSLVKRRKTSRKVS